MCFRGRGKCSFKIKFLGGGGVRVVLLGILRGGILSFFFKFFLSVLWWNFINICSTFTHSFTQFFRIFGGSVSVGLCAFCIWSKRAE